LALASAWRKLVAVTTIQLLVVRWAGPFTFLLSVFVPIAVITLLHLVDPHPPTPEVRLLLGASVISSAVDMSLMTVPQVIGNMKDLGSLDYFMALPLSKGTFFAGICLAYLLQSAPSAAVTFVVGSVLLVGRVVSPGLWIIPAYLLLLASLLGLAALLASRTRNSLEANAIGATLGTLLTFAMPVYYPITHLPVWLQWVARFTPVYYSALLAGHGFGRGSSLSPTTLAGILLAFAIAGTAAGLWAFRWRR
jgi:ABC-2 type transport system permease protein